MGLEKNALDALVQNSYTVTIGGKAYKFYPVSNEDRMEIAEIASRINVETDEPLSNEAYLAMTIDGGRYGKELSDFIVAAAHIRVRIFGFRMRCIERIKRKRLYAAVHGFATIEEIQVIVKQVVEQLNPAFFLSTITFLSHQNLLKQTKETEATALG